MNLCVGILVLSSRFVACGAVIVAFISLFGKDNNADGGSGGG